MTWQRYSDAIAVGSLIAVCFLLGFALGWVVFG